MKQQFLRTSKDKRKHPSVPAATIIHTIRHPHLPRNLAMRLKEIALHLGLTMDQVIIGMLEEGAGKIEREEEEKRKREAIEKDLEGGEGGQPLDVLRHYDAVWESRRGWPMGLCGLMPWLDGIV